MELRLHAGLHRTGTTAFQELLTAERDALRALGVWYPRIGSGSDSLADFGQNRLIDQPADSATCLNLRLLQQITRKAKSVDVPCMLLSAEDGILVAPDAWRRAFPDHDFHVTLTTRSLGSWLGSLWKLQTYLDNCTEPFVNWLQSPSLRAYLETVSKNVAEWQGSGQLSRVRYRGTQTVAALLAQMAPELSPSLVKPGTAVTNEIMPAASVPVFQAVLARCIRDGLGSELALNDKYRLARQISAISVPSAWLKATVGLDSVLRDWMRSNGSLVRGILGQRVDSKSFLKECEPYAMEFRAPRSADALVDLVASAAFRLMPVPSAFDEARYLELHADVRNDSLPARLHWRLFGGWESRAW